MTDEHVFGALENSGLPPILILVAALILRYGLLNASVAKLRVLGAPARKFLARRERKIALEVQRQQASGQVVAAQVAAMASQVDYFAEQQKTWDRQQRQRDERLDRMSRYVAYVAQHIIEARIWRAENSVTESDRELLTFSAWEQMQTYHGDDGGGATG